MRLAERLKAFGYWTGTRLDVLRFCRERSYRPQYVYAWLKDRVPGPEYLARLAADLGVQEAWLMFGGETGPGRVRARPLTSRAKGSPPRLEGGSPLVDLQNLVELTERLATLEAQLAASVGAFPDLHLWLNGDGVVLGANATRGFGLRPGRRPLAGRTLAAIFGGGVGDRLQEAFARAIAVWAPVTVEYVSGAEGRKRTHEARVVPAGETVARARRLLVIVRDVTEQRHREAGAAALAQVGRDMTATLTREDIVRSILSTVRRLFGVRGVALFRVEPISKSLVCIAAVETDGAVEWPKWSLSIGQGLIGRAMAEGRTLWTGDVLNDPRASVPAWLRGHLRRKGYRSVVVTPLKVRGQPIGALAVADAAHRRFTAADLKRLSSFADQAAIALENARLYDEVRRFADRLQTVNRLNRLVSASLDSAEVFRALARAASEITGAAVVVFALADEATSTLTKLAFAPDGTSFPIPTAVAEYGTGALGWAATHRELLNIPDVFSDGRISHVDWWRTNGLTSFFATPILHDGAVLGILALCAGQPLRLTASDQILLDCFTAHAGIAIRNARVFEQSDARRRAAEALAEIGHLLSETLDPEVVGERITGSVRDLFNAQSSALYRKDPRTGDLVGLAGSGEMGAAFRRGVVMPHGGGVVGLAVRERRPVATENVLTDPRVTLDPEWQAGIQAAPYRAILAMPLITRNEVIGALSVADAEGRRFGLDDIRLAQGFAAQAALTLENARVYTDATRRWREAEALARVARTLTESLDPRAVAESITESVLHLFGTQSAGLRVVQADGMLAALAFSGRVREFLEPGHVFPAWAGLPGRAVAEEKPVWSPVVLGDPTIRLTEGQLRAIHGTGDRAMLAAPLAVRGRITGALVLADQVGRVFTADEIVLLQTFADQAALALDNARLYEQERRKTAEQAALLRLFDGFAAARDVHEIASHASEVARDALEVDLSAVLLANPDGTVLDLVSGIGWGPGSVGTIAAITRAGSETGHALETRTVVVFGDVASESRFAVSPLLLDHHVVSGMCAPVGGGEPLGALGVYMRTPRRFTEHEADLLALMANQTALAIARSRGTTGSSTAS